MTRVEIVAEVGSNHNGDLNTAIQLIDAAANAGATTVKFQHYPDTRYGPHPMPPRWLPALEQRTRDQEVGFLCSVFDHDTLDQYATLTNTDRVKIASPELTHHDLIDEAARRFGTVILATGMSTPTEISDATSIVIDHGSTAIVLHCVSAYPAPASEMNLRAMTDGLSDHSLHPTIAPVMAVALGATMIEKHFTLDTTQPGPDHSYALDPYRFCQLVDAIRIAEKMLGDGVKRVQPSEDLAGEWRRQQSVV